MFYNMVLVNKAAASTILRSSLHKTNLLLTSGQLSHSSTHKVTSLSDRYKYAQCGLVAGALGQSQAGLLAGGSLPTYDMLRGPRKARRMDKAL